MKTCCFDLNGFLLSSTCTLNSRENKSLNRDIFLSSRPVDFSLRFPSFSLPYCPRSAASVLSLWPLGGILFYGCVFHSMLHWGIRNIKVTLTHQDFLSHDVFSLAQWDLGEMPRKSYLLQVTAMFSHEYSCPRESPAQENQSCYSQQKPQSWHCRLEKLAQTEVPGAHHKCAWILSTLSTLDEKLDTQHKWNYRHPRSQHQENTVLLKYRIWFWKAFCSEYVKYKLKR